MDGEKDPLTHGSSLTSSSFSSTLSKIRSRSLSAAIVVAPLISFVLLILWFSQNRLSPNPANEASVANPLGLVISNFVYDGHINVENIILSCVFLLIVFLYFPKMLRFTAAFLLPFMALAAAAIAEITAISTPLCAKYCSFYGMSAVANAVVGFTVASFVISFVFIFQARRSKLSQRITPLRANRLRNQAILAFAFVMYLILLLLFAGAFTLQTHGPSQQTSGSAPPTTVFIQTTVQESPPVKIVHSSSLVVGFLLFLTLFVLTNHRYRLFMLD